MLPGFGATMVEIQDAKAMETGWCTPRSSAQNQLGWQHCRQKNLIFLQWPTGDMKPAHTDLWWATLPRKWESFINRRISEPATGDLRNVGAHVHHFSLYFSFSASQQRMHAQRPKTSKNSQEETSHQHSECWSCHHWGFIILVSVVVHGTWHYISRCTVRQHSDRGTGKWFPQYSSIQNSSKCKRAYPPAEM